MSRNRVSNYFSVSLLFILLSLTFVSLASATTRLHKGPIDGEEEKIIHGSTVTISQDPEEGSLTAQGNSDNGEIPRRVDFDIHIKRDVVMWDELAEDGTEMSKCWFKAGKKRAVVVLSGDKLDVTDFTSGVILAIDQQDMELNCQKPFSTVRGIDPSDPVLFYEILETTMLDDSIKLKMSLVRGSQVVPVIDVNVYEEESPLALNDEPATSERQLVSGSPQNGNDTLSTVSRPTVSKTFTLGHGVTLEISASADVRISSFRLTRLWNLRFEWDQRMTASVSAELRVANSISQDRSGELLRHYIPGLSFTIHVPLAGSLKAGSYIGINWVADFDTGVSASLTFSANYVRDEHVTATLLPPSWDATNNLPTNSGASGSTSLDLGTSASIYFNGFIGVRPVIGAGLTLTKKVLVWKRWRPVWETRTETVNGNLGCNVGLELDTVSQSSAFRPYTGAGLFKGGICHQCHYIQGALNFIGKRLSVQTVKNGRVEKEKMIVENLFSIRIGTICLLHGRC